MKYGSVLQSNLSILTDTSNSGAQYDDCRLVRVEVSVMMDSCKVQACFGGTGTGDVRVIRI
jgi:hypothetical protein